MPLFFVPEGDRSLLNRPQIVVGSLYDGADWIRARRFAAALGEQGLSGYQWHGAGRRRR
jgi:hypothetical protein